jgi:hypothetical protein
MSLKSTILSGFLFAGLIACEEVPEQTKDQSDVVEQSNTRQLIQSNNDVDQELSCLEARGTIYADCLVECRDRQECGTEGRQWYRTCLE